MKELSAQPLLLVLDRAPAFGMSPYGGAQTFPRRCSDWSATRRAQRVMTCAVRSFDHLSAARAASAESEPEHFAVWADDQLELGRQLHRQALARVRVQILTLPQLAARLAGGFSIQ